MADVAVKHPTQAEELIALVTTGTDPGDGQLEVSFTLTDNNDGVTGIGFDAIRFSLSDIVPAGTAAGAGMA